MSTLPPSERRRETRMALRAHATLASLQHSWPVHLVDISYSGALIALLHEHDLVRHEKITLNIDMELGERYGLSLRGHVAHLREHYIGLQLQPCSDEDRQRLQQLVSTLEPVPTLERTLGELLAANDSQ